MYFSLLPSPIPSIESVLCLLPFGRDMRGWEAKENERSIQIDFFLAGASKSLKPIAILRGVGQSRIFGRGTGGEGDFSTPEKSVSCWVNRGTGKGQMSLRPSSWGSGS